MESNLPPLGLGYIASYLRQYYGNLDINISNNLEDIIRFKPDIVGITGYTQNFEIVKKMSAHIKQELSIPIIIGGHHITAVPQNLPESCDIGVIGEGEETMHQLLIKYEKTGLSKESLYSVKGIVFKDSSLVITEKRELIEPLDRIPYPARNLFELKTQSTHIITSRGCPYRCSYCSSCIFWEKVRMFTPEYVVNEIEQLIDKYGIKNIYIYDDIFILNKERVKRISELIEQKGINSKVSFSVQARVNLISEEICQCLKKMNVTGIGFGFESGSENMLKSLKGSSVSISQTTKTIELCKKYEFSVFGPFIIGSPYETKKDIIKSIEFFKKQPIDNSDIYIATPLPGTQMWDYAIKRNLVNYEMDWSILDPYITDTDQILNRNVILSDKISKQELLELYLQFKSEILKKNKQIKSIEQKSLFNKIKALFYRG
ncbi:Ribosomal protein S12 methylthiotransferase RimO [uncultured archaeon]|nr:Ribosomal protein S12 methylthiotransferase RimO [uncultured archaeon]